MIPQRPSLRGVKSPRGQPVEMDLRKRRRQVVAQLASAMATGTRQQRRKLARDLVDIDLRIRRKGA